MLKMSLEKKAVRTEEAGQPYGQYSQGIIAGDFLFIAGQIGLDKNGHMVLDSPEKEIKQVFENIKEILEAGGSSFKDVVRTLTFVKDLDIYETFKKVRAEYYPSRVPPPVNSFIQISDLQKDASIEIEVVALVRK
jgi:2-iminobutanoate/2-iminopropanoate deaminase